MHRLPIVIICESHLDYNVHLAYRSMFHAFKGLGYDTLCLEHPSSISTQELKQILTETIRVSSINTQQCLSTINRTSQRKYTATEFLSLKYLDLADLIQKAFPELDYYEIASHQRSILPNQQLLANLAEFSTLYDIFGVDVNRDFDLFDTEPHKQRRDHHMAAELVKHYNNGKNIIFTVGKVHLFGLYRELTQHGLLQQTLFLDMYSIDTQEFDLLPEEKTMLTEIKSQVHTINLGSAVTIDPVWAQIKELVATHSKPAILLAYKLIRSSTSIGLANMILDKLYPYNKPS